MAIYYTAENQQQIEIEVKGPGNVKRMLIFTGELKFNLGAGTNAITKETITHKLEPTFAAGEFVRAIAFASPTEFGVSLDPNQTSWVYPRWKISNADADWDDETGKVEFEVELEVANQVQLRGLTYEVKVLTK